jgi:hypothetical protein
LTSTAFSGFNFSVAKFEDAANGRGDLILTSGTFSTFFLKWFFAGCF